MQTQRLPVVTESSHEGGLPFRMHTHQLTLGEVGDHVVPAVFAGVPGYLDTRRVWHEIMHATMAQIRDSQHPVQWMDYSNSYRSGLFCDEFAQERARRVIDLAGQHAGETGVVVVNAHSMGFGHAVRALEEFVNQPGGVKRLQRTALVGVAPAHIIPKEVSTMSSTQIAGLLLPDMLRVAPVACKRWSVASETGRIIRNALGFAGANGLDGPIEAARHILSQDVLANLAHIAPHLGTLAIFLGRHDPISPGLAAGRRLAEVLDGIENVHIRVANTGHVGHVAHPELVSQVARSNAVIFQQLLTRRTTTEM